jgi:hypothetical protein
MVCAVLDLYNLSGVGTGVPCVEAGLNTSTVALPVVRGDEKGTQ